MKLKERQKKKREAKKSGKEVRNNKFCNWKL